MNAYLPDFSKVRQDAIPANIKESLRNIIRTMATNNTFITHLAMSPKLIGQQTNSRAGYTVKGGHILFKNEKVLENKTYFNQLFLNLSNIDFSQQDRSPASIAILTNNIKRIVRDLYNYGENKIKYSKYIHIQNINQFNNNKYKRNRTINHKIEYKDICEIRFNYTKYPEITIVIVLSLKNINGRTYKIKTMYPQKSTLDQIKHSILSRCKALQYEIKSNTNYQYEYENKLYDLDEEKNKLFEKYNRYDRYYIRRTSY